jgi:ATP-dependent Clp protease ATP-binding subunit ClpB
LGQIYGQVAAGDAAGAAGAASQPGLSQALNKALEQAFKEAENFKDEYVSTEHLLLGVAHTKGDAAREALAAWARRMKRF